MTIQKLALASGNQDKLRELQELLAAQEVTLVPQSDFSIPEAVEDGLSFVENAIIKARHACKHTGLPAIADDSGLEVDALNGEPGIYSARYASQEEDGETGDKANNRKLLHKLEGIPENRRTARFQCAIALVRFPYDPMPLICQGTWEGSILFEPAGDNGFGYDPLFYVPTHKCSSAELSSEVKNSVSHRGRALVELHHRWHRVTTPHQ